MNQYLATGRLVADPELRRTKTGLAVCSFRIAVSTNKKDQDGKRQAVFLSCISFDKTAELISEYCSKGSLIGITAQIQDGSYTNKEGETIRRLDFIVNMVDFLESKKEKAEPAQPAQPKQESYPQNAEDDDDIPF
ncbi:MAG: single-stranded DNA-binding protein [Elusimicrobiota bacterium]|jgi:single-strand DNA-binding protein|nr:single-stranded DNA-binding protein [Elusimicrobiota bacterium]